MRGSSQAILEELVDGSLLIGDLPEAPVFDRSVLRTPELVEELNYEQKLGHLYEDALASLLNASESIDCLARGLQIFDETGRTLGELDFVCLDHARKEHVHLELAVKFYLAVERSGTWHFPGPDPKDNWQRKLARMRSHQLVLGQTDEARAQLRQLGIDSIVTRQLVYGRLFLPMGSPPEVSLESMSSEARLGRWLYVSEWSQHFPDSEEVRLISKPYWPLGLTAQNRLLYESISVDELKALAKHRCTLFASDSVDEPIFLVPDTWLQGS